MLRNLGIRSKLLAVLCVPMAFLMAVSGVLVAQAAGDARRANRIDQLTTASTTLVGFVHQLQLERSFSEQLFATKDPNAKARAQGQRQVVDSGLRQLKQTVASSPIKQVSPAMAHGVEQLLGLDAQLPRIRKGMDSGDLGLAAVEKYYDQSILVHLGLGTLLGEVVSDSGLARSLSNYTTLSTLLEYAAQERDLLDLGATVHHFTTAQHVQYIGVATQQDALFAALQNQVTGVQKRQLQKAIAVGELSGYQEDRTNAEVTPAGKPLAVDAGLWDAVSSDRSNQLTGVEQSYGQNVGAVAGAIGAKAQHRAILVAILALVGLLIALGLVLFLARRITAPLRRLTTAAEGIRDELPRMVEQMQTPGETADLAVEPIMVGGADEIGRLAEAFNAVNDVTVRVALEQAALRGSIAEMFVNVARRNQTLLGRQLSFLDQLEAREEDPDTLEDLFKLDHLAARMRRNAESLLVLAGIDATRRLRAPMALSDVVRTAIGEIENYDRVDLAVETDPSVSGRVALSVAHMIAELIDNAAHFSNPDTRVKIVTRPGADDAVEVFVADSGLGMTHEELVGANARLSNPPATEIAVAQRLGLYVVGRLAKKLEATVTLRQRRSGGTSARVRLPASVLAGLPTPRAAAPAAPAATNELRANLPARAPRTAEPVAEQQPAQIRQAGPAPAARDESPALPAALAGDTGGSDDAGSWQPAFTSDATPLTPRSAAPLTSRRRGEPEPVVDQIPAPAQVHPLAEQPMQEQPVAEQPVADGSVVPEPATAQPVVSRRPAERPRGRRESFFRRRGLSQQAADPIGDDDQFTPSEADASLGLADLGLSAVLDPAGAEPTTPALPSSHELPGPDTLSQLVEALTGQGAPVAAYEPVHEITALPVAQDILPQRGRAATSGRSFTKPRRRDRTAEHSAAQSLPADPQPSVQVGEPDPRPVGPVPVGRAPAGQTGPLTSPTDASQAAITEMSRPAGPVSPAQPLQGPGEDAQAGYGDDLAFRALAELSQLSAANYQPAYAPAGGLARRQPRKAEAAQAAAPERPSAARNAEQVRGVLSGFRAGVQRGRTSEPGTPSPVTTPGTPVDNNVKEGQQ